MLPPRTRPWYDYLYICFSCYRILLLKTKYMVPDSFKIELFLHADHTMTTHCSTYNILHDTYQAHNFIPYCIIVLYNIHCTVSVYLRLTWLYCWQISIYAFNNNILVFRIYNSICKDFSSCLNMLPLLFRCCSEQWGFEWLSCSSKGNAE